MAYRSLYRRWRPQQFKEVTGQDHITRTLSHALSRENISHAYLFCGPRGTGKTTAAKIMAKALNCHHYPAGEPCGVCSPCVRISQGTFLDVMELDAASHRGIEEVRELREKSRYATSEGRHSVYIIDEAHMLTNEAFNALLKTLEEPPSQVVFILATTEPSKLPPTVISRCQRFDFRLLLEKEMVARMEAVLQEEGWSCQPEALPVIARLAEGALRDALGLLEQCYVYSRGEITLEHVYDLTGLAPEETLEQLLQALAQEDVSAGIQAIREVTYGGKDLHLFVKEQLYLFTQLLIARTAHQERDNLQEKDNLGSSEEMYGDLVARYRDFFSYHGLMEIISQLHQLSNELKYYQNPHFYLEIAFINQIKALRQAQIVTGEGLWERIEALDEKLSFLEKASSKEKEKNQSTAGGEERIPPLATSNEGKAAAPSGKEADLSASEASASVASEEEKTEETERTVEDPGEEDRADPASSLPKEGRELAATAEVKEKGQEETSFSLESLWKKTMDKLYQEKPLLPAYLEHTYPVKLEKGILTLAFPSSRAFHRDKVVERKKKESLEEVLSQVYGRGLKIKTQLQAEEEIQKNRGTPEEGETSAFFSSEASDNSNSAAEVSPESASWTAGVDRETEEEVEEAGWSPLPDESGSEEGSLSHKMEGAKSSSASEGPEKAKETTRGLAEEAQELFRGKLIKTDE